MSRGNRACTEYVPRSASGPAWNVPPSWRIRRRIPVMPIPSAALAASAWLVTVIVTPSPEYSMRTVAAGCGECLTTFVSDSCSTR